MPSASLPTFATAAPAPSWPDLQLPIQGNPAPPRPAPVAVVVQADQGVRKELVTIHNCLTAIMGRTKDPFTFQQAQAAFDASVRAMKQLAEQPATKPVALSMVDDSAV